MKPTTKKRADCVLGLLGFLLVAFLPGVLPEVRKEIIEILISCVLLKGSGLA